MEFYAACVATLAVLLGFNTPARDMNFQTFVRVVVCSLAWPIIVLAAAGHAARDYSPKRRTEDFISTTKHTQGEG